MSTWGQITGRFRQVWPYFSRRASEGRFAVPVSEHEFASATIQDSASITITPRVISHLDLAAQPRRILWFATRSAEFLICARCGIYVGAQLKEEDGFYAIANLRTFEGNREFALRAEPMDYSGENSSARRTRRASRWTPVASPA